jgi:Mg-chelatase subunit ChlD
MKTCLQKLVNSCLLAFTLSFFAHAIFAQTEYKLALKVLDNQAKPIANTEVLFTEMQTKQKIRINTNSLGIANYNFTSGKFWQFDILQIKDYYVWQFEVRENIKMTTSRTVTYDYKNYLRESRPVIDRSKLNLQVIDQKFAATEKPTATEGIAKVEVRRANNQPLTNFLVQITCYALNKSYRAYTDAKGTACFKVPINNDFQIDIDGIDNFSYIDLQNKPFSSAWHQITYEPTQINEIVKNDTITQKITSEDKSSSARVLSTLTVRGGENGSPANTNVYLQGIKTKKVYVGKTDNEGKVRFLLPKGDAYMINFRYQFNVDVFNLTRHRGIGYSTKTLHYSPEERLQFPEHFIPIPASLYLTEFQHYFEKQFPKPQLGETLLTHAKFCGQINANSTQAVLQLGFSAEDVDTKSVNSKPLNIAFVVDKSGSMWGEDRINSLKEALKLFVEKLREIDVVSLSAFNDEGAILIPAQKVGKNKIELLNQIQLLEADGGTDIWSGLQFGYQELQKNYKAKQTNRLILLSDGYGSDNPIETIEKSQAYNDKGLETSTVGVGQGYNAALMTKLASQGGGTLELTKNSAEMQQVFANSLAALMMPIAEEVKVEVLYNKQLLFAQLLGYPIDEKREGKVQMKLKKVYAGMADQLAMIKFTLVNPTQNIENEPITIITNYFDIRTQKTLKKETQAKLSWSATTGQLEYVIEREDKKVYGIAIMNWALKAMADAFVAKEYGKAKQVLEEASAEMKKMFPKSEDKDVEKLMVEIATYSENLTNLIANTKK